MNREKLYLDKEQAYLNTVLGSFKKYGFEYSEELSLQDQKILKKYRHLYFSNINDRELVERIVDEIHLSPEMINSNLMEQYIKFILWNKSLFSGEPYNQYFEAAINFNLLCCMIDRVLDEESCDISKESILRRTNWDNVCKYFTCEEPYTDDEDVIDYLYKKVCATFAKMMDKDVERYQYILKKIKEASVSEFYMATHELKSSPNDNLSLLVDKSISFEEACYLISAFEKGDQIDALYANANNVAKIYWLIDDICDLFEDFRSNNNNSILSQYVKDNCSLEETFDNVTEEIEKYICLLLDCFSNIEKFACEEFYIYLKATICKWKKSMEDRMEVLSNQE